MKTPCNRQLCLLTLYLSLTGAVWGALSAGAAQGGPYDLDLKELLRPPVRPSKGQGQPKTANKVVPAAPNTGGKTSVYTVRQGDHLFLILMQRYGLSNRAAEELIPEIMRLNGIRRPESLSVGQHLTIPLPPVSDTAAVTTAQTGRETSPSPPPESASAALQPADTLYVREIAVNRSRPCLLAREVAEQMGVSVTALPPFIEAEGAGMSYDALKVTVICGLDPAEEYTFRRLLTTHGARLLFFKADETPRSVIESIAGTLGISFRLTSADTTAELPLTYLFPAAIDGKDLRLTIFPAK